MCMCVCLLSFSFTHTPLLFCLSYCSFVFVFFIVWCVGETTTHILFRYCASFILIAYRLCLSILFFCCCLFHLNCVYRRGGEEEETSVLWAYICHFYLFFVCIWSLLLEWRFFFVFFRLSSVLLPPSSFFFLACLVWLFFFVFVVD